MLELAQGGRVKFHEDGEIIFSPGEERGRWVWMIQRGAINLYRPGERGEELIDVRVEGDLLGVDWADPTVPYPATARVAEESILYALPSDRFVEVCRGNAKAAAFLQSYFVVKKAGELPVTETDAFSLGEHSADWLLDVAEPDGRATNRLLLANPEQPIREVAKMIAPGMQEAVVVVDAERRPIGVVTEANFSAQVATGDVSVDTPVRDIMSQPVVTIPPRTQVGDIVMTMMRRRRHHLVVTETGGTDGRVVGVVGEKTIQAVHGNVPVFLSKEFTLARDLHELRRLRDRADELLLRFVEGEARVEWLTNFVAQVDRMLTEQTIVLAKEKLLLLDLVEPDVAWSWVAFHSEGRKERLLRSSQRTGIIYADPAPGVDREPMLRWFSALANELGAVFSVCRFPLDRGGRMASNSEWCMSVSEWQARFQQWVQYPIENEIITLTPFFDLRAITGDRSLVQQVRSTIRDSIVANPAFVPLLATDAMAHLPPVTVFRGSVIDAAGEVSDMINTKSHALTPLVDIARVFALGLDLGDATFTPDRLRKAGEKLPKHAALFAEAAEAFDHALKLQTRVGLNRGDAARFVRPDELTRVEIQRLKSIFRTVAQLMDITVKHFHINAE